MTTQQLRACLLVGSMREGRLADRVSTFMQNKLKAGGWDVDVMDAKVMDLDGMKKPLFFYKNQSEAPTVLCEALEKIRQADAFMLITCEYNHCLPPGLTAMIDHFAPTSFSGRPSSIVCYSPGIYGGIRAAMQARCLMAEVKSPTIPDIFGMPKVHESLDDEGKPLNDKMDSGAERHIKELEWYATALKNHRAIQPL